MLMSTIADCLLRSVSAEALLRAKVDVDPDTIGCRCKFAMPEPADETSCVAEQSMNTRVLRQMSQFGKRRLSTGCTTRRDRQLQAGACTLPDAGNQAMWHALRVGVVA